MKYSDLLQGMNSIRRTIEAGMQASHRAEQEAQWRKRMASEPARTEEASWRDLLKEFSEIAISMPDIRRHLSGEQVSQGWLGKPPATDNAIAEAEARLGIDLPPSYKAFLRISNGWSWPSPFVHKISPVERIAPFVQENAEWVEICTDITIYGSLNPWQLILPSTIQLSDYDGSWDCVVYLLNPTERNSGGELQAWTLGEEGASRSQSFWHLMNEELRCLRNMVQND